MNKSQRIYLDPNQEGNDMYMKVRLQQETDSIEFLSMKIDTKDVYRDFNADYGVLVGRVTANGGIGIPNAKVSIFIPLAEEDYENGEIKSVYPYKSPRDKNIEGKRYNLLPRVSRINPKTQQIEPKQPFGSFPIKEEVVTNSEFLTVYKKYYKYTALTNNAGDYMIFGVPIGTQTVHLSVDITDIGEYSMNPASMVVNLGYSASQFIDRGTRIKPSTDLGDLPNIETQEISVDIIPFWGDTTNFEIGITRQDFRIRAVLTNTFTIFGSAFTDSDQTMRATEDDQDPNEKEIRDFFVCFPQDSRHATALTTKRIGKIKETIYYYPSDMTDVEINNADPKTDMLILNPNEYSAYYRNGDFVFIINCNRDRVVTDEEGNKTSVNYDNPNGVFTTFRGFVTLEYTLDELPIIATSGIEEKGDGTVVEKDKTLPLRIKLKFPQHAGKADSFDYRDNTYADAWRKQHMKFEAQKFYSFSRFHPTLANKSKKDADQWNLKETLGSGSATRGGFFKGDYINLCDAPDLSYGTNKTMGDIEFNIGVIQTNDNGDWDNAQYQMIPNCNITSSDQRFGSNWLNLSVYFPQIGYMLHSSSKVNNVRVADFLHTQWKGGTTANPFFIFDNTMPIAGGQINTKGYARSDLHWTDIIEIPLEDIIKFSTTTTKGFRDNQLGTYTLKGAYRNGNYIPPSTAWKGTWSAECPYNGGRDNGNSGSGTKDPRYYFYKGFDTSDCIEFLYDLGLVTG